MTEEPQALATLKWWPFWTCVAITWLAIGWLGLTLWGLGW